MKKTTGKKAIYWLRQCFLYSRTANIMSMDRAEIIPSKFNFYTDNSLTFCKTHLMTIYIGNKKRKDEEPQLIPCRLVETNVSNRNERVFSLHIVILQRIYPDTQNFPEWKWPFFSRLSFLVSKCLACEIESFKIVNNYSIQPRPYIPLKDKKSLSYCRLSKQRYKMQMTSIRCLELYRQVRQMI